MDANQITAQIAKWKTRVANSKRILQDDMESLSRRPKDTRQMEKVKSSFRLAKASLQEIHIFTEQLIGLENSGKFPEGLNHTETIASLDRISRDLENALDEEERILRNEYGNDILMDRGFSVESAASDESEWPEEDEYGNPIEAKPKAVIQVHDFDEEKDLNFGGKKNQKRKTRRLKNKRRKTRRRKTRHHKRK